MRSLTAAAVIVCGLGVSLDAEPPRYRVLVASESGDVVTQLRWDGTALTAIKTVPVGLKPADIDGAHNVAAAPDGSAWYVTIAHGTPYGSLWKFAAPSDSLVGRAPAELFPTTIALTPDGALAFVANSDFHGDHPRVNVVTVVATATMTTITHLPACDMPHGVKVNAAGSRVYVSCMHSDEILEIDRQSFRVLRRHRLAGGALAHAPPGSGGPPLHTAPSGPPAPSARQAACSPTFVAVSPDDRRLYVACHQAGTLQVLDAATFELLGEIAVGAGAYNVEPSPGGRWVLVTNKKAQSVSLIDAAALTETARIATSKPLPHGIAYAPDGTVAFVTAESVGADSGAVDVIDLAARRRVFSQPLPRQPTGIAVLTDGAR